MPSKPTNGVTPATSTVALLDPSVTAPTPVDQLLVTALDEAKVKAQAKKRLQYGCGGFEPSWLQCLNRPQIVLIWLCIFCACQSFVVNGINHVNTTTLELRYHLSSTQAGLISSMYDISAGLLVIPVSYFGGRAHQPRLLAIAAFVMALGTFVMCIPHWAAPPYEQISGNETSCSAFDVVAANATCAPSPISNYLYVFLLGQALNGFGGTTLFTLGLVYVDSNVPTTQSPLYHGIMYGSTALGPTVGYLIGGYFLRIYVDIDKQNIQHITLTPEDPRWVGAWWIGFLAGACLFIVAGLLLLPYPPEFPGTAELRKQFKSQAHSSSVNATAEHVPNEWTLKDLPVALSVLFRNPVFVCIALSTAVEGLMSSGVSTFLGQYIQNQYELSASTAAIAAGIIAVPAAVTGQFFGGLICRQMALELRGMLRLCVISATVSLVFAVAVLGRCHLTPVAGITMAYNGSWFSSPVHDLQNSCNAGCHCTTLNYEPVCDFSTGLQYFSSCHAGCTGHYREGKDKFFTNCSCLSVNTLYNSSHIEGDEQQQTTTSASQFYSTSTLSPMWSTTSDYSTDGNRSITLGKCSKDKQCALFFVFAPIFFVMVFSIFLKIVPLLNATLRCVPHDHRAFGLGVKSLFLRFLGTVPGPVLFGQAFDHSCIAWQEKCGARGTCWLYDSQSLSYRIFGSMIALMFASDFFIIASLCLYRPPPSEAPPAEGGAKHVSPDSVLLVAQPSANGKSGVDLSRSYSNSSVGSTSSSVKKPVLRYSTSNSSARPMLASVSADVDMSDELANNDRRSNHGNAIFPDATDDGFQTAFLSTAV